MWKRVKTSENEWNLTCFLVNWSKWHSRSSRLCVYARGASVMVGLRFVLLVSSCRVSSVLIEPFNALHWFSLRFEKNWLSSHAHMCACLSRECLYFSLFFFFFKVLYVCTWAIGSVMVVYYRWPIRESIWCVWWKRKSSAVTMQGKKNCSSVFFSLCFFRVFMQKEGTAANSLQQNDFKTSDVGHQWRGWKYRGVQYRFALAWDGVSERS